MKLDVKVSIYNNDSYVSGTCGIYDSDEQVFHGLSDPIFLEEADRIYQIDENIIAELDSTKWVFNIIPSKSIANLFHVSSREVESEFQNEGDNENEDEENLLYEKKVRVEYIKDGNDDDNQNNSEEEDFFEEDPGEESEDLVYDFSGDSCDDDDY